MFRCSVELKAVQSAWQAIGESFKQPNPLAVKTIADYVRDHNFPTLLRSIELDASPYATNGATILLSPWAFFDKEETALRSVKHEGGHIGDLRFAASLYPVLKEAAKNGLLKPEDNRNLALALYDMVRKKIPKHELKKFNTLSKEIFGNLQDVTKSSAHNTIAELFRLGEEVENEEVAHWALSDDFQYFMKSGSKVNRVGAHSKQDHQTSYGPFVRLILVAQMKVSGVWDEISSDEDFDQTKVQDLDPRHIEFFEMFIEASKYYHLPEVRNTDTGFFSGILEFLETYAMPRLYLWPR